MANLWDDSTRLEALIAAAEPKLARRFLVAVAQIRDRTTLRRLAPLLRGGSLELATELAEQIATRLSAGSALVFQRAGESTATLLNTKLPVTIDFDRVNQRAVEAIRLRGLRVLQEVTDEQVGAIREALIDGTRRGLNPVAQARQIRGSLGLTRRQMQAVNSYRRALETGSAAALERKLRDRRSDRSVRAAMRERRPLPAKQIDMMVERYRQRSLDMRARTIARTEAMSAVHQGSSEMYEQAVERGLVNRSLTTQTWVAARDERTRDTHASMSGQQQTLGTPFVSPSGASLRYPGDPTAPPEEIIQCRCTLTTRVSMGAPASSPAPAAGGARASQPAARQAAIPRSRRVGGISWSNHKKPDEALIVADVKRLDRAWSRERGYYIPKGGGGAEIKGRREGFKQFLRTGKPVEAPRISITGPGNRFDGSASFTDGRHRFSVLRDQGIRRVLIRVPKEEAASARLLLGPRAERRGLPKPKPRRRLKNDTVPSAGLPTKPSKPRA